ncbi:alpha/beta fold hydrolase [Rheinheimera pacifica]|uniref:alpha/beta fold hydrolase n=1 Tax=Rheinheimera pacifica TaxID=173990 RepID=UPI002ED7B3F0
MRMLFTLTGYVLAGYCLLCLLLYLLQRQLIYFPVPAQLPPTDPLLQQQADATVLVSRKARETSQALLYFGGNSEDVSVALPEFAAAFPNHAIYLMHYRGYGGSSGKPSEQAQVADALALFDQLQTKHSDITVLGRSLGSGIAVQLAALYQAFAPGIATLRSYSGSHNSNLPASQLAAWLATATP